MIKVIHWGRYAPGYKDYSLIYKCSDIVPTYAFISGVEKSSFQRNIDTKNINIKYGRYNNSDIKAFSGNIALLPYTSGTQSAVLVEAINLGFIPLITNLDCFHEFLPIDLFKYCYISNSNDLSDNIYTINENRLVIIKNLNILRFGS
jgi:hypothetical protein